MGRGQESPRVKSTANNNPSRPVGRVLRAPFPTLPVGITIRIRGASFAWPRLFVSPMVGQLKAFRSTGRHFFFHPPPTAPSSAMLTRYYFSDYGNLVIRGTDCAPLSAKRTPYSRRGGSVIEREGGTMHRTDIVAVNAAGGEIDVVLEWLSDKSKVQEHVKCYFLHGGTRCSDRKHNLATCTMKNVRFIHPLGGFLG